MKRIVMAGLVVLVGMAGCKHEAPDPREVIWIDASGEQCMVLARDYAQGGNTFIVASSRVIGAKDGFKTKSDAMRFALAKQKEWCPVSNIQTGDITTSGNNNSVNIGK